MHAWLFVSLAALAWAQEKPAEAPASGSASGIVIDSKSGEPMRNTGVILQSKQTKGIATVTDAEGKFSLLKLEPGTYRVSVDRDGFVLEQESSRQSVTVRAGANTADIKLKLARTGVISGRVLDAEGEPVTGASVQVFAARKSVGGRPAEAFAQTNDRGEYRAFHIAPGAYKISAIYKPHSNLQGMDIQLRTSAAAPVISAYPVIYYPGTFDVGQATSVSIEPGSEMQGIDLHLVRQHAVKVRGRVIGQGPASALSFIFISLSPPGQTQGHSWDTLVREPDGQFELLNVLPGSYRLSAVMLSAASNGIDGDGGMKGSRTVKVGTADVEGIEVTVGLPREVSGRIVVPQGQKVPADLVILLESQEPGDTQSGGMAVLKPDGSFVIKNVPPDNYFVVLAGTARAAGLYVNGIRLGDTDALAEGLSVTGLPLPPLEIILKPNGGTLDASVNDEDGKALSLAKVWLVPDTPRERQIALYGECETDEQGLCRLAGIAPGSYHVYAFAGDPGIDHRDPASLTSFEKFGKPVKVGEGDKQKVELSAAPLP